jgi:hypothetical protein
MSINPQACPAVLAVDWDQPRDPKVTLRDASHPARPVFAQCETAVEAHGVMRLLGYRYVTGSTGLWVRG